MIVAHLADLHLGFRAYQRQGTAGNLREQDVARAFQDAVKEIGRLGPDLVLVAGDVFDRPEPPASALVTLTEGLANLRSILPDTPILMVAGARDTPRSWGDPGVLAAVDTFPGVEAAAGPARSVHFHGGSVHALLLPHRAVMREGRPDIRPDRGARWNILLAHGAVRPVRESEEERAGSNRISASDWSYVALGHEHAFRRMGDAGHVVYAGALERVGPAPWTEAHRPRGFAVADLEAGTVRFREIPGRPIVDLAPIRWNHERPERMNERMREVSRELPGGIDGKIVRFRLRGMGPDELCRLDSDLLSTLRERAFHLVIEVEEPEENEGEGTGELELRRRVLRHVKFASADEEEVLETALDRLLEDVDEADAR